MSKKTLLAAIKPLMSEIFIENTENIPGDDLLTFSVKEGQNVLMTCRRLGLYRELFREYKAECDNIFYEKQRKRKVKALKAFQISNYQLAKFNDANDFQFSIYVTDNTNEIGVKIGGANGKRAMLTQDQVAALIPLLKRFVRTGRIVKGDDAG